MRQKDVPAISSVTMADAVAKETCCVLHEHVVVVQSHEGADVVGVELAQLILLLLWFVLLLTLLVLLVT